MTTPSIASSNQDFDPSALVKVIEASDSNYFKDVVLVLGGEDAEFNGTEVSSYISADDSSFSSSEGEYSLSFSLGSIRRISVRVSSDRLRQASPVFEAMLFNTSFSEAHELATTGRAEIQLPEDDAVAFLLVLCVAHNVETKSLPGEVNLDTLMSIAVLVDKYIMHESMEDAGQEWAERLQKREGMPWSASEDGSAGLGFAKWLCIASVFGLDETSMQLKHIAEKTATGRLDEIQDGALVLPLRPTLVDEIESRRCEAIGAYISLIGRLIKGCSISDAMKMDTAAATAGTCKHRKAQVCEHRDGSNVLPDLPPVNASDTRAQYRNREKPHVKLKSVIAAQLTEAGLWPLPSPPYEGLSCMDVRKAVLCLQLPESCGAQSLQTVNKSDKMMAAEGEATNDLRQLAEGVRKWWKRVFRAMRLFHLFDDIE